MIFKKSKKTIFFIFYILLFTLTISFFFYFFDFKDLTDYPFLKNVKTEIINFKEKNLFFFNLFYILFCMLWLFFIGIGIPIVILTGMIYGKIFGTVLFLSIIASASTIFYISARYFFYDFIKKKFANKYSHFEKKFKENEFLYFLLFKFVEGIPFAIANSIPVLFNVKARNIFFCTFIGLAPSITILVFFGSGLNQLLDNNKDIPHYSVIYKTPELYLPIILIVFIFLIGSKLRKLFKKTQN